MKKQIMLLWPIVFMLACSGPKVQLDETAGSGPLDEQIALINEHITDPEKREKCLVVADDWNKKINAFYTDYQNHINRIKTLQADYHSSKSQFQETYDQFNPKFEMMLMQLIVARQTLVELTSEEEWKKISVREKSYVPKTPE